MKYDAEFQKQTVEYKNMPKTKNRTSLIKIINVERKYMLNKTTHNIYVLWQKNRQVKMEVDHNRNKKGGILQYAEYLILRLMKKKIFK